MKNPTTVRNFIIFSFILACCLLGLGYHIFKSSADIKTTDRIVSHTQMVIMHTQKLINLTIGTIGLQRNFLNFRDDDYLKKFEDSKIRLSKQVTTLRELTRDNPSQASRIMEIEHLSLRLKDALDSSTKQFREQSASIPSLKDREEIAGIMDNILRLANDMLSEEYDLLLRREAMVTKSIDRYQISLLIGGIVASIIILIFNWYLLEAQSKISMAEANLKESEERLRLAIRGSNDGIFDWNFKNHQLYWSPQYKAMLGYEDNEIDSTEEIFRTLLHPEDQEYFWENFNNYINGSLSEFSCIFRMVHKGGRTVWIHGRGKAIFDEEGQPVRFIGAHTDVSYIKEHERQLQEEKDRAERASAAKGEFLAHMSHEIRTPLTAVSGIAEIFSQGDFQNDMHRKLVMTLKTSTESLKELITDILDFSRIESGEVELHNQSFLLGELFDQVINIMTVKANEKHLEFSFHYDELKETAFFGDKQRLRQILINLVGNAIKFTEKGHVTVRARIEPVADLHILRIDVEDSGIGIPEHAIELIFDKFRQADSSVSRRYGGSGLGLSISRNLATMMGGTIKVTSEQEKGSTFSLILPFTSVLMDDSSIDMSEVVRVQKLNDRLKALIGEKKRILLVEDYEGNIVVLSYILNSLNCAFDVAKTGLEAVQKWKERHYDLVLMDVQMPEMDGLTATRIIRNVEDEQGLVKTPIIGLTAHALMVDKQKCIDAGMDDYLSKPIVEDELKSAILRFLDKKQPGGETRAARKIRA